jgi:hypothetical protein
MKIAAKCLHRGCVDGHAIERLRDAFYPYAADNFGLGSFADVQDSIFLYDQENIQKLIDGLAGIKPFYPEKNVFD